MYLLSRENAVNRLLTHSPRIAAPALQVALMMQALSLVHYNPDTLAPKRHAGRTGHAGRDEKFSLLRESC